MRTVEQVTDTETLLLINQWLDNYNTLYRHYMPQINIVLQNRKGYEANGNLRMAGECNMQALALCDQMTAAQREIEESFASVSVIPPWKI